MINYSLTSNVLNYMLIGQCNDTTNGVTDDRGEGCDWYESRQSSCGHHDTSTFNANTMCCTCDGGSTGNAVEFFLPL